MNLYVLELLFAGLQVRASVNGIELVADDSAASKTIGMRLNPYVVDGENTLALALRLPPPSPSSGQASAPPPDFTARLIRGVLGRDPGAAGVMLEHEWNPATTPLAPGVWKAVLDQTWIAPVSFGRWAWQDAPAALTPTDLADVRAEAAALHAAAGSHNARALVDAHRLKFSELARALDMTDAELLKDLADSLAAMFAARDYRVAPLEPAQMLLEPLASGRLVRVRRADGQAPLQLSGGGEALQLIPIYTRVGGRWVMAR